VANRDREDLAGALHNLAFFDAGELAEYDNTDLAHVEVKRQPQGAVLEPKQLVRHTSRQSLDLRNAVTGQRDAANLVPYGALGFIRLHVAVECGPNLFGTDRQLSHYIS